MRTRGRWRYLLLILLVICPVSFSQSGSNPRVMLALLDFDLQGSGFPNQDMGRIVVEWLTTALVRTGRVDVVERALLKKVLEEQKLGLTGMIDRETAARIGDVLGAKIIVTGSVISLGSKIEVNARLIRTSTATVVAAETVKGEGLENLERLVHEMAQKIVSDFPLEGYVVAVDEAKNEATIDLGREVGVVAGTQFEVFTEGTEIRHPVTGEVLSVQRLPVAMLRAVQVGPKTSRCEVVKVEEGRKIAYGQRIGSVEAPPAARSAAPEAAPAPPTPAKKSMVAREEGGRVSVGVPGCGIRRAAPPAEPGPGPAAVPPPAAAPEGWKALAQWSSGAQGGRFDRLVDVAVDPATGSVYVLDLDLGGLDCFDADGKPVRHLTLGKVAPMGVAVGPDGGVWVAAAAKHQVLRFNAKGEALASLGRQGRGTGELLTPVAVAVDGAGNVLVAELKNERVQKFDPQGKSVWVAGSAGKQGGQFSYPIGIAAEESGAFYVCDRKLGRVDAFDAQGAFVRTLISGLDEPSAIHLTRTRELLVAETGKHRILVVDPEGRIVQTFGKKGRDVRSFVSPWAAAGLGAKVYVADTGNRRVQVFER